MLRFNILNKLKPAAIVLVSVTGPEVLLSRVPVVAARKITEDYIGFYFRFRGKSTPIGDLPQAAYFPKIADLAREFSAFCPLSLLSRMHARGYFIHSGRKVFRPPLTAKVLCAYLVSLAGRARLSVELALIKTHSLRIGGHTYFTAMGMNPDLTDYLGRRKVSRSSLRYFRASPCLTISAVRRFFASVPPPFVAAFPPPSIH